MRYPQCLFLTLPLIALSGCNSSSDSNSTTVKPQAKPLANYIFSQNEKDNLLEDRKPIQSAVSATFRSNVYDTLLFTESMGENSAIVKLADKTGDTIDIYIQPESSGEPCILFKAPNIVNNFQCNSSVRSGSNDTTLINAAQGIQLEYKNELMGNIGAMGSTKLTVTHDNNKVTINTSFAFDAFYDVLFKDNLGSDRRYSTLGTTTYLQLEEIVENFEGSEMIFRFNNHIGGSADDDINIYSALLIHEHNMNTLITKGGSVFSGGTDLFAAGKKRELQRAADIPLERNKQIGVHSWAQGDKSAKDFPYTDKSHRKFATFFDKVMGKTGIDFYLFTLDSAPPAGEHWVTQAESDKYGFITEVK